MRQIEIPDLALSCWIVEAARSMVLHARGDPGAGVRAAERARILARVCASQGVKIQPRIAGEHGEWMAQVAGSNAETGALGAVFLQRLGAYVDAHMKGHMPAPDHRRLILLSEQDLEEVNEALSAGGLPDIPEDDWPPAPSAEPVGKNRAALRFGILGDPHIEPLDNRYVEMALHELESKDVAFIVVPGDITKDGEQDSFDEAARLFHAASAPVLSTLGNHDMTASAMRHLPLQSEVPGEIQNETLTGSGQARGSALFAATFGTKPYGIHELDGVRVILLNSAVPALSPFPPFDILGGDFADAPAGAVAWGDFSEEMSDWMAEIGPSPQPTFVLLHHPPYPYPGFPPLLYGLGREATGKLAGLVEASSAQAVFCGHTHRSARRPFEDIHVFEVPSVSHWPLSFGIVEIGGREGGGKSWWSFQLHAVAGAPVAAKDHAAYIFRRYAAGDKTGHSFFQELKDRE